MLPSLSETTRVLQTFHEKLSAKAAEVLKRMGVELMFDCHVTDVAKDHVVVTPDKGAEPQRIGTETVIWAAGVKASPLGKKLAEKLGAGVTTDRGGRITVGPDCTVPGHPEIFVVGDTASLEQDGKPLPGVAQTALQQGRYAGEAIGRGVAGRSTLPPFRYRDFGTLASLPAHLHPRFDTETMSLDDLDQMMRDYAGAVGTPIDVVAQVHQRGHLGRTRSQILCDQFVQHFQPIQAAMHVAHGVDALAGRQASGGRDEIHHRHTT